MVTANSVMSNRTAVSHMISLEIGQSFRLPTNPHHVFINLILVSNVIFLSVDSISYYIPEESLDAFGKIKAFWT